MPQVRRCFCCMTMAHSSRCPATDRSSPATRQRVPDRVTILTMQIKKRLRFPEALFVLDEPYPKGLMPFLCQPRQPASIALLLYQINVARKTHKLCCNVVFDPASALLQAHWPLAGSLRTQSTCVTQRTQPIQPRPRPSASTTPAARTAPAPSAPAPAHPWRSVARRSAKAPSRADK